LLEELIPGTLEALVEGRVSIQDLLGELLSFLDFPQAIRIVTLTELGQLLRALLDFLFLALDVYLPSNHVRGPVDGVVLFVCECRALVKHLGHFGGILSVDTS
jgi:hypothetical protein